METIPRARSSILSEDPEREQQVSYQIRHPPNSTQKQALEKLDDQLRHHAIEAIATYVGNWTPFAAAETSVVSSGRGWRRLCSL